MFGTGYIIFGLLRQVFFLFDGLSWFFFLFLSGLVGSKEAGVFADLIVTGEVFFGLSRDFSFVLLLFIHSFCSPFARFARFLRVVCAEQCPLWAFGSLLFCFVGLSIFFCFHF